MPPAPKPSFPKRPRKVMKKFNAKRKGNLFPKNVDEDYRAWIRQCACIIRNRVTPETLFVHHCRTPVQACHVRSRGAAGKDRNNLFPACGDAHMEQHAIGAADFERRWDVSLRTLARQLTQIYEAEKFPLSVRLGMTSLGTQEGR